MYRERYPETEANKEDVPKNEGIPLNQGGSQKPPSTDDEKEVEELKKSNALLRRELEEILRTKNQASKDLVEFCRGRQGDDPLMPGPSTDGQPKPANPFHVEQKKKHCKIL